MLGSICPCANPYFDTWMDHFRQVTVSLCLNFHVNKMSLVELPLPLDSCEKKHVNTPGMLRKVPGTVIITNRPP